MIVLDENFGDDQRQILHEWHIATRKIGEEVGHYGIKDREIIPLLHQLRRVTFFTLDLDFYKRHLCHPVYCLAYLVVLPGLEAAYVRQTLKHPAFNTTAKRMGTVVRITPTALTIWRLHAGQEETLAWPG